MLIVDVVDPRYFDAIAWCLAVENLIGGHGGGLVHWVPWLKKEAVKQESG